MDKRDIIAISIMLANILNGMECVVDSVEISKAYSVAIRDIKKA